jgi:hypothetical protein
MKRSILIITLILLVSVTANSQGKFLKNVAKDVKNEVLGTPGSSSKKSVQPEPACACSDAQPVISLEEFKLEYSEISIDILDDGSFLVFDRIAQKYYIISNGARKGPYTESDPAIAAYNGGGDDNINPLATRFKEYITKQGDKYLIKFNGKTYGPYARIDHFAVTRSKDKFAATVVENVAVTEDEGQKMDEAIKKAKTDAEKMELAMQYSQQMSRKIMSAGGADGISAKIVTNIEGATYNPMTTGPYNSSMKYDNIVYTTMTDVVDLSGKKLITLKQQDFGNADIWVNSGNSAYASYTDGTLTISDGRTLSELFNPHLTGSGGKVWLEYMYYSPSRNSIMQCKIAF